MAKKLTRQAQLRLADPDTAAATNTARNVAKDRYGPQIKAVWQEIQALTLDRPVASRSRAESQVLVSLWARLDELLMAERHFAEKNLAFRLNPGYSAKIVDA